uniref:Uncharacterized protein n=1 Tax=Arundo donax TaxID=35708 RepID=A0A0A9B3P4_ARUDO
MNEMQQEAIKTFTSNNLKKKELLLFTET